MQAKSRLYARRVKGDLDLGLEPARIGGDGERRWSELITPGGLLPGGTEQDIYTLSTIKNYRIGTRRLRDERVFRYARVGDISKTGLAGVNSGFRHGILIISENCLTEVAAAGIITCIAGQRLVTLDMSAAVDMWGAAVAVGLDEYEGGYFTFSDSSVGAYWGCKILANTAEDEDGYVTFYLEATLPATAAAGDMANVCQNPWWRINYPNGDTNGPWSPYVGALQHYNPKRVQDSLILEGMYIWVQTWGPLTGVIMGRGYGIESAERMLYGHTDGTFVMGPQARSGLGEWPTNQPAGWFMNNNYNGGAPYDMSHPWIPVVFLMIAP